jgi:hypothetical protein
MNMYGIIIAGEVIFSPCLPGKERTDTLYNPLPAAYERILEFGSEAGSVMPMLEVLDGMLEEPLDLNLATEAELEQIPGVGPLMARRIVTRRSARPFRSLEDLTKLEGVNSDLFRTLSPFLTVKRKGNLPTNRVHIRSRTARNGLRQLGSTRSDYLGSPDKLYTRISGSIRGFGSDDPFELADPVRAVPSLNFGIVTEKDPGERSYFDFIGGHLCLSWPAIAARILIGDFIFESGQGLVFWRSSGLSKGGEATAAIARKSIGFRPSFSTDQAWTFRGTAVSLDLSPLTISAFCSGKTMDATIDSTGVVTQFDSDGLHRTAVELEKRNQVGEKAYGARATYEVIDGLQMGVSALVTRFDKLISLPGVYGFRGNGSSSFGLDFGFTLSSLHIFGETAQDSRKARAAVFGMVVSPSPEATIALLTRVYPREFQTFHGAGFSENGLGAANESGFYCGISVRPAVWLKINAYWDQFSFPWRTSSAALPSAGSELFVRGESDISGRLSLELQLRHKEKPADLSSVNVWGLKSGSDEMRTQQNCRLTLSYRSVESLVWKSRVEIVAVEHSLRPGRETGILAFQDFSFSPVSHATVSFRLVAFDTPSFDSRLYEYEEEVPGTYLTPALYGRGFRWYCVGSCELVGRVGVSLKYSQTKRDAVRKSAFTGGDALASPDDRLTVQLDVRL